jgi:hypothetical protein
MKKHYRHENDCLNCGTILEGKFCHNCGQENLQMKESFGHMITHAVSDYFHFDDQFFSTLKPLLFKPGKLTVAYLAGHRASYLHPVKMYIFISLVFFLLFFKNSKHDADEVKHSKQNERKSDSVKKAIDKGVNNTDLNAEQKKEIANNIKAFLPKAAAVEMDANMKKDSAMVRVKEEDDDQGSFTFYKDDTKEFKTYNEYVVHQNTLPADKQSGFLKNYMVKKNYDWLKQGKNAKEVLIEGLKHNTPKMMFLLLPMFAFILKLAFWKNNKFYVEHIIYTIHLHCYLFLFLIITMLLKMLLPESLHAVREVIDNISALIIIWYVYRSLRVVYNRSRWRTVSKMFGVSIMYTLVFAFSFFVILIITAVTSV